MENVIRRKKCGKGANSCLKIKCIWLKITFEFLDHATNKVTNFSSEVFNSKLLFTINVNLYLHCCRVTIFTPRICNDNIVNAVRYIGKEFLPCSCHCTPNIWKSLNGCHISSALLMASHYGIINPFDWHTWILLYSLNELALSFWFFNKGIILSVRMLWFILDNYSHVLIF